MIQKLLLSSSSKNYALEFISDSYYESYDASYSMKERTPPASNSFSSY